MSYTAPIRAGQEREIGCAGGWRYVIERSEGGSVFWVTRKSMSLEDHGRRCQIMTARDTEKKAEKAALDYMRRAQGGMWGGF